MIRHLGLLLLLCTTACGPSGRRQTVDLEPPTIPRMLDCPQRLIYLGTTRFNAHRGTREAEDAFDHRPESAIIIEDDAILLPQDLFKQLVPPVYAELGDPFDPALRMIEGESFVVFDHLELISQQGRHCWRLVPPRDQAATPGAWALAFGSIPGEVVLDAAFLGDGPLSDHAASHLPPSVHPPRLLLAWRKPGDDSGWLSVFSFAGL